jgi:hypothetical protein
MSESIYFEGGLNHLRLSRIANENNRNLLVVEPGNLNMLFAWNGQRYKLIHDLGIWKLPCTVDSFTEKLAKAYLKAIIFVKNKETVLLKNSENLEKDRIRASIGTGLYGGGKSHE